MSGALRDEVRTLFERLSGDELVAARRYLEQLLEERGIDPYAHLDAGDALDDDERERMHASIEGGLAEMRAGKARPAAEVLAELRQRR